MRSPDIYTSMMLLLLRSHSSRCDAEFFPGENDSLVVHQIFQNGYSLAVSEISFPSDGSLLICVSVRGPTFMVLSTRSTPLLRISTRMRAESSSERKRLGQIVVRSAVQTGHLVLYGILRREKENRSLQLLFLIFQDGYSVDTRKHDVQDRRVVFCSV